MKQQQQAILARDIIQMIREYQNDTNVLEYLESFCVSLSTITDSDSLINWKSLAEVCDQRYYSTNQGSPIDLNDSALEECESVINAHL